MGSGMYPSPSPMGMDCCPKKKIWGSMNQKMDGMYVNVGKMPWGKLPMRCNSDCVYDREGSYDGLKYCFGDSMYSQSECAADILWKLWLLGWAASRRPGQAALWTQGGYHGDEQ